MLASRFFKSEQFGPLVSFKTAAWSLLTLFCGFSNAATATSTVVLISPVSVMTSIAAIAPVITTAGGWITIRLSVPQIKQLSGPSAVPKEENTGKSRELLEGIEAEKPNLEPADVQVSEDRSGLNIPSDFATLGLSGQPIVSVNLSTTNTPLDAAGLLGVVSPNPPKNYRLTAGFN
jgi:hypothetical protein